MASGDVFANLNLPVTEGSPIDVQPAADVQICLTFIGSSNNTWLSFGGKNSVGTLAAFTTGLNGTGAVNSVIAQMSQTFNMKLFINNSQYIFFTSGDVTRNVAYSGIEI